MNRNLKFWTWYFGGWMFFDYFKNEDKKLKGIYILAVWTVVFMLLMLYLEKIFL